jgi:hypothetical protein
MTKRQAQGGVLPTRGQAETYDGQAVRSKLHNTRSVSSQFNRTDCASLRTGMLFTSGSLFSTLAHAAVASRASQLQGRCNHMSFFLLYLSTRDVKN